MGETETMTRPGARKRDPGVSGQSAEYACYGESVAGGGVRHGHIREPRVSRICPCRYAEGQPVRAFPIRRRKRRRNASPHAV
jgi:hypothetical protein